jgi:hypothetical protein
MAKDGPDKPTQIVQGAGAKVKPVPVKPAPAAARATASAPTQIAPVAPKPVAPAPAAPAPEPESERTRVAVPGGSIPAPRAAPPETSQPAMAPKAMEPKMMEPKAMAPAAPAAMMKAHAAPEAELGPVVGWLVVVRGPGKGRSVEVGYGVNRVGRGPDQRIVLDFGDGEISRDRAAEIAYDPKTRRFVLIRGTSTNLIYHNDIAVYQPTDLTDGDLIQIGNTTLRFVPLCGPSFSWEAIS